MIKKHICILYSGGLDSFIMKRHADKEFPDAKITCVWYNIGQPYNYKESSVLPEFVLKRKIEWLKHHEDLVAKADSNSGNIIIPGRNAVLSIMAASQFLPDEIWMGALLGEIHKGSTDKNLEFLYKLNNLLNYTYSPFKDIKLVYPFVDMQMSKLDAVSYALHSLSISADELTNTSSCLSMEKGNCGRCVVCARRYGIFSQLGIKENYNIYPFDETCTDNIKMIIEMKKGKYGLPCHYDIHRRNEILPTVTRDIAKGLINTSLLEE